MVTKIRRRLGVLTIALSGLLAAGLLFSAPAFAWNTELKDVSASCPPGSEQPRVDFTLRLFDTGHSGHVEVAFKIGEGDGQQVDELFNEADEADNSFSGEDQEVKFHFFVDNPSEDTAITVVTVTFFDDLPKDERPPSSKETVDLTKCAPAPSSSTTTTVTPTTQAPTTLGPSTTAAAEGNQLPFTGSNSLPMLLAALVMLVGGGAALFATRIRGRHAK